MNINDSEVVLSVLQNAGYSLCDDIKKADVILVNTCSIRENAEQRVWGRLDLFLQEKKRRSGVVVGVLGCMAERLKQSLLEHAAVDFVAGPDSYRRIAGLIEGASQGAGLGHSFLRHVERTRLLVHVLDISGSENRDPLQDFELINNEIFSYDEALRRLPMIVVANKMDMPDAEKNLERFTKKYGGDYEIVPMTTIIHEGVAQLIKLVADKLETLPPAQPLEFEKFSLDDEEKDDFAVEKLDDDVFEVTGGLVKILARKVNMDDYDSFGYFQRVLKERGVIDALRRSGAHDGCTVIMGEIEFDFVD